MAYISEEFLWEEFENNPEAEQEVGAVPIETPMSVCLVTKSDSEGYIFSEEIPATISWQRREVRPFEPFWRLEVKIDQHNSLITPNTELIVSQLPYSNKWGHSTRFQKSSTHPERGEGEIPGAISTLEQLLQFLDTDAQWDYFQKGKYLTAGISKPFSGSEYSKQRNIQKNAVYLFGACDNLSAVKNDIYASEQIQKLLYLTEINQIRFTPISIVKDLAFLPKLKKEVIENRVSLMAMAILQALSGPVDSTKYLGKSVLGLVELCYKQLLNYENRKNDNDDKLHAIPESQIGDSIIDTFIPADEKNPEQVMVENQMKKKIRKVMGILTNDESSLVSRLFGIDCQLQSKKEIIITLRITDEVFLALKKSAFAKLLPAILEDPDLRDFIKFK